MKKKGCLKITYLSFPVAFRKKDIMRKLLNIFLTEIKSDDLKGPLWTDFIEICDAIYKNDMPRLQNTIARGENIDVYSIFRGVSSIKNRKELLSSFDENYLRFCPLHVSAVCDNIPAAKMLTQMGADPFQRDVLGRTSLHLANSAEMLKNPVKHKRRAEMFQYYFFTFFHQNGVDILCIFKICSISI